VEVEERAGVEVADVVLGDHVCEGPVLRVRWLLVVVAVGDGAGEGGEEEAEDCKDPGTEHLGRSEMLW